MDLEKQNKELVLKGFDTLFNKRDYLTAEKFWSPDYIQHSAHIPPGERASSISSKASRRRCGMSTEQSWPRRCRDCPRPVLRPRAWASELWKFAADILRIKDGVMAEHWDVLQDEASRSTSKSGLPMFGEKFIA